MLCLVEARPALTVGAGLDGLIEGSHGRAQSGSRQ